MSDELIFSDEPEDTPATTRIPPWHILIVDDEPAVHEVTKLVLADFVMDGRSLQFSHCYSAAQARVLLSEPNEIALILLDVVMESEHAGLDLVRHIRTTLANLNVRIILRTGQPGQAPEEQVIRDYDINDYKEKTDLTRRKLVTVFYAGLRAYRDLMRLEGATQGLRRSIEAIRQVFETQNLRCFASAVLDQVNYLLDMRGEGLCASRPSAYAAQTSQGHIKVLAATPAYSGLLVDEQISNLPTQVQEVLQRTLREKTSQFGSQCYAGYCVTKSGSESVIYMEFSEPPSAAAHELLSIFSTNVAITYDGLLLLEESQEAHRESIAILASTVEKQFFQPALHLKRVSKIAALLAHLAGLAERDVEQIRNAAALHDVGMSCIDEGVLMQPEPLTAAQWEAVKRHTTEGYQMLSASRCSVHACGALMARDHHERWDGTGYPSGLAGNAISLEGRIAAIADLLASMTLNRRYQSAQTIDAALEFVQHHSGSRFDPNLAQLVRAHISEFRIIF